MVCAPVRSISPYRRTNHALSPKCCEPVISSLEYVTCIPGYGSVISSGESVILGKESVISSFGAVISNCQSAISNQESAISSPESVISGCESVINVTRYESVIIVVKLLFQVIHML